MDSTVDVLSEQPWGKTYTEWHDGYNVGWRRGNTHHHCSFPAQFKLVSDRKGNSWLRGDLVLFNSGFHNWNFDRRWPWKKWFMTREGYLDALKNDPTTRVDNKIPKYARSEYGILLSRYKWIKDKGYKVFQDYGSIIIMLTGSKSGKIRRYYLKTPYSLVSRYPYDHIIPFYQQRGITEIPELRRLQEAMNYSKSKEQFILNMIASFHDENYPMNLEDKHDAATNFRIIREGTGL